MLTISMKNLPTLQSHYGVCMLHASAMFQQVRENCVDDDDGGGGEEEEERRRKKK